MTNLPNLDSLHGLTFFPHEVEIVADVVADVPVVETYATITFRESESFDGETFLLPRRTDSPSCHLENSQW